MILYFMSILIHGVVREVDTNCCFISKTVPINSLKNKFWFQTNITHTNINHFELNFPYFIQNCLPYNFLSSFGRFLKRRENQLTDILLFYYKPQTVSISIQNEVHITDR